MILKCISLVMCYNYERDFSVLYCICRFLCLLHILLVFLMFCCFVKIVGLMDFTLVFSWQLAICGCNKAFVSFSLSSSATHLRQLAKTRRSDGNKNTTLTAFIQRLKQNSEFHKVRSIR